MANIDALRDKILKLGQKQKIGAVLKYIDNPNDDVRMAAAMALGMIPTYEAGMGLIELLRDPSPFVRATACNSAAEIHAKNCEECAMKLGCNGCSGCGKCGQKERNAPGGPAGSEDEDGSAV